MNEAIDYATTTGFISFEEYLEGEKIADERHEYVDGKVFGMAGASEGHEIMAGAMFVALHLHLKGTSCRAFKGDMKLKAAIQRREVAYYPDIIVACDPADRHPYFKERPKVLVEIMSDYKADNVEKLFVYQQIPSLEEYLVIDPNPANRQAWLYRRATGWQQENGAPAGTVKLASLDFETPLDGLYE